MRIIKYITESHRKINRFLLTLLLLIFFLLNFQTKILAQDDWAWLDSYCLGKSHVFAQNCHGMLICNPTFELISGTNGQDYKCSEFSIDWLRPGSYNIKSYCEGGLTHFHWCPYQWTVTISNSVKDSSCSNFSFSLKTLKYVDSQYSSKKYIKLEPGFSAKVGTKFKAYICTASTPAYSSENSNLTNDISICRNNSDSLGINNDYGTLNQNDKFIVYPNPTKNIIYLDFRNSQLEVKFFEIFNSAGRLVDKCIPLKDLEEYYFLDNLNGIYIIKVTYNNGIVESKKVLLDR